MWVVGSHGLMVAVNQPMADWLPAVCICATWQLCMLGRAKGMDRRDNLSVNQSHEVTMYMWPQVAGWQDSLRWCVGTQAHAPWCDSHHMCRHAREQSCPRRDSPTCVVGTRAQIVYAGSRVFPLWFPIFALFYGFLKISQLFCVKIK